MGVGVERVGSFGVQGSGFGHGDRDKRFGVWNLGLRELGFEVWSLGCGAWGLGVWGLGCEDWGFGVWGGALLGCTFPVCTPHRHRTGISSLFLGLELRVLGLCFSI